MYFDEIKGWRDGVKIRRKSFSEGTWIKFNSEDSHFYDEVQLRFSNLYALLSCDDWELYEEPKKQYSGVDGFVKDLGCTVRECIDCGCLTPGGPTRCKRCAKEFSLTMSTGECNGLG